MALDYNDGGSERSKGQIQIIGRSGRVSGKRDICNYKLQQNKIAIQKHSEWSGEDGILKLLM